MTKWELYYEKMKIDLQSLYSQGLCQGEQRERPPPRNPENLQRMGNNPRLSQQ